MRKTGRLGAGQHFLAHAASRPGCGAIGFGANPFLCRCTHVMRLAICSPRGNHVARGGALPPAAGWQMRWGEWAGWRQRRLPALLPPPDNVAAWCTGLPRAPGLPLSRPGGIGCHQAPLSPKPPLAHAVRRRVPPNSLGHDACKSCARHAACCTASVCRNLGQGRVPCRPLAALACWAMVGRMPAMPPGPPMSRLVLVLAGAVGIAAAGTALVGGCKFAGIAVCARRRATVPELHAICGTVWLVGCLALFRGVALFPLVVVCVLHV